MNTLRDLLHELRLKRARKRFLRHPCEANYKAFAELCRTRSPRQIERMERASGVWRV
jgi:hypothetical protein